MMSLSLSPVLDEQWSQKASIICIRLEKMRKPIRMIYSMNKMRKPRGMNKMRKPRDMSKMRKPNRMLQ